MAVSKKVRELIFNKYGGRCAYCGCELVKGWHVDHFEAVGRYQQYVKDENGNRVYCHVKHEYKTVLVLEHPQNDVIENYNPACASCNLQKSGNNLEAFRKSIAYFINSLNAYTNQYKFAKRYGLVVETQKPVVFYFETLQNG